MCVDDEVVIDVADEDAVEKKFRNLALQNSIKVIGSYNPRNSGCKEIEFHDFMHPMETCMKKILAQ